MLGLERLRSPRGRGLLNCRDPICLGAPDPSCYETENRRKIASEVRISIRRWNTAIVCSCKVVMNRSLFTKQNNVTLLLEIFYLIQRAMFYYQTSQKLLYSAAGK